MEQNLLNLENQKLLEKNYNDLFSDKPLQIMNNNDYLITNMKRNLKNIKNKNLSLLKEVETEVSEYQNKKLLNKYNPQNESYIDDFLCIMSINCYERKHKANQLFEKPITYDVHNKKIDIPKSFSNFKMGSLYEKEYVDGAFFRGINIYNFYLLSSNLVLGQIFETQRVINENKKIQKYNFIRQLTILISFIFNIMSLIGLLLFFKVNLNHFKNPNEL